MVNSCKIPVSAKTRIGFDDIEDFNYLNSFMKKISDSGCKVIILHARKAILKGLSPKANLTVPKLNYPMVYRIKEENNNLEIIINGGITDCFQIKDHLKKCDGVMIGRAIYQNPYFLSDIENEIFDNTDVPTRSEIAEKLVEYVKEEVKKGTRVNQIMRHTVGLYHGKTGANKWRRYLSDNMMARDSDFQKVHHIMEIAQNNEKANQTIS
jgi:tRNA-dihydrouridine synthase A